MKKRIIALILSTILCASLLPYHVFADLQAPVEGISSNSIVGHTKELGKINPLVELNFTEPKPSGLADNSAGIQPGYSTDPHTDFYYQVDIKEYPNGRNLKWPDTPKKLSEITGGITPNGIPVQGLDNGRLYRMSIIPYHYHKYDRGTEIGIRSEWAPRTGAPAPYIYVLTDFDTRMEGKGGSLEVTWEDSGDPDMKYEIGYIQGNYEGKSLEAIKGNMAGNSIQYISSEDIKKNHTTYRDPQTGRTRFKYVIENNIATGQIYSAYVVSATDKIENKDILKNRETPKVVTATTEIGLNVYNAGKDKVRLEWDAQLIHAMDGEYKLEQTQIKEYAVGQESGRVIATLYGKDGADIGYYQYREPKESTYYQLVFIYRHKNGQTLKPEPQTAKVLYVPGELRTKPATPEIPKPIGPSTEVTAINKGDFLVPGDQLPDVPNIDLWKSDHTFHVNASGPPSLNFVWSAYKEDLSLLYDIWVTDDIDITKEEVAPIVEDLSFNNGQNPGDILYNKGKEEIVGFKHTLKEYYNSDMRKQPLVPNKVYYIKIVAKKLYGDELESSLPAIVTIMFNSDGEVFAPPMISKPPLILDPTSIAATSITIRWLESWYEIAEKPYAKEWNAKVYTTDSSISFTHTEGAVEHVLTNKTKLDLVKGIVGTAKYDANYLDRSVNLGKSTQYEYKYRPYQEILNELESYNSTSNKKKTVEEYIEMLMKNETDPDADYGWQKITPTSAQDDDYIEWKQHKQDGLKPNTSYVFFVKPYSYDYDGTKLQASLPTWIIGTTLPDGEMEEGKPTVPVLSLNGKGDTHISVEWEYNSAFDYEIRYSRLENPDTATVWPFEIGTEKDDPTYVENGGKAIVTITGLFPETTYNVWIRAKQKKGSLISAWSNPVTAKTDILGAPASPPGLGIASYNSILEAGKDFKPVESNHITVEWQRIGPDKDLDDITQDSQRVSKEYKYVIELADNPEFIDKQSVTVGKDDVGSTVGDAEILSRSMVYFGKLIANRPYYVRAKTVLIAQDKENNREIVKESAYSQFIRIITKTSQEEYDGGDKMNEVIYPEKVEESFDGETWIYEIMDTQRVINEMVTEGQFRYVIPVQKYRGTRDAKFRVIRIPQPVITTLINRRMELEIRTNILSMQIPAKALESHMISTAADGMVEFTFETLSEGDMHDKSMGYEYGFLSTPEKMGITVKGPKGVKSLDTVDALLKVKINMPGQTDYASRNMGGYTFDSVGGTWKKGNHQFDKVAMQLTYTSGSIGTYAVYEKTRVPGVYEQMTQSMTNVAKKYDIVGLGTTYTPTRGVTGAEYINIMIGIAEKRSQIKPNEWPTAEEIARARNSGIYMGQASSALTQEAAISGVVKLYELVNGISVRPQTNEDLSRVSRNYRDNIQKAYTLGLIYDIRPTQQMTYAELFNLIEQVID